MYALFVILNQTDKLDEILESLYELDTGATTLDSVGMGKVLLEHNVDEGLFSSITKILNEGKPYNKTLISVIRDKEVLDKAVNNIKGILNMKEKRAAGFMFVLPVLEIHEGL
ncbi:hypothetical protein [Gudongella sp. SC589]|jgi:nitrogen regulatory protein PII|uniref:hypothetical protein n=1 Tax=Gudongella sp. SC589 TaxID=3385990 RepID=UPI003904CA3E